jgi:hypothetical protein
MNTDAIRRAVRWVLLAGVGLVIVGCEKHIHEARTPGGSIIVASK